MAKIISLPEPQTELDFPLMKAIQNRRTDRKWKDDGISDVDLSNLLWAACGITKEKYGRVKSKRTAPSACNSQEIRVYTLLPDGVFLYDEENHQLIQTLSEDLRENVGTQKMMKSAPAGTGFRCRPVEDEKSGSEKRRGAAILRMGRYRLRQPEYLPVLCRRRYGHGSAFAGQAGSAAWSYEA